MGVCKFFQQGNCRYGQNCRFDHIYGSKFSYHAPTPVSQPTPSGVTDEQLVNQVQSDVQSALKGGQWILSSYSPFKEKPNFPGLSDLSMEEARLFIYEAKANNNLDQAVAYMNNLFKEARSKYEQLYQPSLDIMKVLRSLYKGEIARSPFPSNGATSNTAAGSIFRSAVQGSIENNPTNHSVFGQSPENVFSQNSIFSASNDTAAKSIFAQANHNIFGQNQTSMNNNIFTPSQPSTNVFEKENSGATAKSIFAQASQNIFQTHQPQNNVNIFQNVAQSGFTPSPFQQQENTPFSYQDNAPFRNIYQTSDKQNSDDRNIYRDIKDVSEIDMEAFNASNFRLGFIPESPPPSSLCF